MKALLALVPRRFRFRSSVAFCHLCDGGRQTLLTVSAAAAGVVIAILVTSLIFELQDRMTELLTEAIPHITIQAEKPHPMPLAAVIGTTPESSSTRLERQARQRKLIDNWPQVIDVVRGLRNVRTAAPVVKGPGFVSKGVNSIGVSVVGSDPVLQDQVGPVTKNLVAGKYVGLGSEDIVIDAELAKELNVGTGERIRLTSSTGTSDSFSVVGIYSRGQERGSA
jgi:lipoprotein-releasing system permease protein